MGREFHDQEKELMDFPDHLTQQLIEADNIVGRVNA
jgi:hypothetical protein